MNKKAPPSPSSKDREINGLSRKTLELLKFELLKGIDLFKDFSPKILRTMAVEFKERMLKKEEILFEDGDPERSMFIILEGGLFIHKNKKPIAELGPGEYVGEMSLIESKARAASARALSDTVVLEVNEEQFKERLLSEPEAMHKIMKTLSHRLRNDLEEMAGEMQKLSVFTHDMRNCLVPLGITEVLFPKILEKLSDSSRKNKTRAQREKIQQCIETIDRVKSNLVTLIDQSLAFAKKSKSEYIKQPGDIVALVDQTLSELVYHKHLKDKRLEKKVTGSIKECDFNFLDIKRVLQNLVINSGYASAKGGLVDVILKDMKTEVQISVKDQGQGIPKDVRPHLLKENYTTKPDGNGFGLLSCKDIIENYHQGKIWFESKLKKGTTFHFTLPYSD